MMTGLFDYDVFGTGMGLRGDIVAHPKGGPGGRRIPFIRNAFGSSGQP